MLMYNICIIPSFVLLKLSMFSVDFWSSETGIIHEPLLFQSLDFLNKMFPTVLNVLCFPEEQTFFNNIIMLMYNICIIPSFVLLKLSMFSVDFGVVKRELYTNRCCSNR